MYQSSLPPFTTPTTDFIYFSGYFINRTLRVLGVILRWDDPESKFC